MLIVFNSLFPYNYVVSMFPAGILIQKKILQMKIEIIKLKKRETEFAITKQ